MFLTTFKVQNVHVEVCRWSKKGKLVNHKAKRKSRFYLVEQQLRKFHQLAGWPHFQMLVHQRRHHRQTEILRLKTILKLLTRSSHVLTNLESTNCFHDSKKMQSIFFSGKINIFDLNQKLLPHRKKIQKEICSRQFIYVVLGDCKNLKYWQNKL